MKNSTSILFALLILALFGCKTNQSAASKSGNKNFVDAQSDKKGKPFFVGDSLTKAKENWQLVFSDEFNDTQMDTTKWTVENNIKKRVDVSLYANNEQVEERDGNAFIYYRKSSLHDSAYFAGRFNSKGKFAPTYGYLETRMHLIKPNGCQTAFWMMPNGEGSTAPNGVKDGTANDGAEIDIVEGNKMKEAYSTGLHWDGYSKPEHKANGAMIKAPKLHTEEYHVFGFEWTPTFLKFYYDGNLVRTIDKPTLIPHVAHYIYFSGSCFGESDWVTGDVRKNEFIQKRNTDKAYIDYVRVYKADDSVK
jgi:beta-glucanase (GH16 family)